MKLIEGKIAAYDRAYKAFIRQVNQILKSASGGPAAFSNLARATVSAQIEQASLDAFDMLRALLKEDADSLFRLAIAQANNDKAVSITLESADALERLREDVIGDMTKSFEQLLSSDSKNAKALYNGVAWRVVKQQTSGKKREAAVEAGRSMIETFSGSLKDRSGRSWRGERFLRLIGQHGLYRLWNETTLYVRIVSNNDAIVMFEDTEKGVHEIGVMSTNTENIDETLKVLDEKLHWGVSRWIEIAKGAI